jgi:flagellar biosynthesis protein FlhB
MPYFLNQNWTILTLTVVKELDFFRNSYNFTNNKQYQMTLQKIKQGSKQYENQPERFIRKKITGTEEY